MKRFSLLNSSSIKSYFILYMHFFYNILSHKVSNTVCSKYSEKYVNLKTTKHFTYSSLQANNRKLNSELPEWSLFRRKVSIETTLQKLVPIWSLFAPKVSFLKFWTKQRIKTTGILLSIQTNGVTSMFQLSVNSEDKKKPSWRKKSK